MVAYNPAVQEFHDVKGRADDAVVFAETVDLGDRNICGLECFEDPVFPRYLMCHW